MGSRTFTTATSGVTPASILPLTLPSQTTSNSNNNGIWITARSWNEQISCDISIMGAHFNDFDQFIEIGRLRLLNESYRQLLISPSPDIIQFVVVELTGGTLNRLEWKLRS